MLNRVGLALAALFVLTLAACGTTGGGNNPGPVAQPLPPPPPPTTNDSSSNLIMDETFEAVSVEINFGVSGASKAIAPSNTMMGVGGVSVTYDVGNDNFTIDANFGAVNFQQTVGPAELDATQSDQTLTVYETASGEQAVGAFVGKQ